MPRYKQGNMWECFDSVDYFIITTNAIIKKSNKALVMGAGIAKQVRDRFVGIDILMGKAILERTSPNMPNYGLILGTKLGIFQTKTDWKDNASLDLVKWSTASLIAEATCYPEKSYALNFPAIGCGKLKYADVKNIIDRLPNNVQVWTYK